MNELKEKMKQAIYNSYSKEDLLQKCEDLSREHTNKVLEGLLAYRGSDSNRFYLGIVKAQIAVKVKDI